MQQQEFGHHIVLEDCSTLRARGREALAGSWVAAAITMFVFYIVASQIPSLIDMFFGKVQTVDISNFLSGETASKLGNTEIEIRQSPVSDLYRLLVVPPITYGMTVYFLDLFRNNARATTDLFSGFERFLKTVLLWIYMIIFIVLWALIPIAGPFLAIRAAIRYSQSFRLMSDFPELSVPECVDESKRLMEGNKMKYFVLGLSFIGWYILVIVIVAVISAIVGGFMGAGSALSGGDSPNFQFASWLATTIGLIPVSFVLAYVQTAETGFYELVSGKINGNTSYVRDDMI